jgi:hypothetical protein
MFLFLVLVWLGLISECSLRTTAVNFTSDLTPPPHDAFFKQLFTRPEAAEDFVHHYLPAEVTVLLEPGSLMI